MQPDELRAIRDALGWTQSTFAEALGLSRVFVSNMESGAKPIEERTALAAQRLLEPPLRVSTGTFGDKTVVIVTRPAKGRPGRRHDVQVPAYDDPAEAAAAAHKLAEELDCPFVG